MEWDNDSCNCWKAGIWTWASGAVLCSLHLWGNVRKRSFIKMAGHKVIHTLATE
jgi:hypothetical protein